MMTKPRLVFVFCAILLYGSASALPQTASDTDKHFVRDAIEGGNAEVELGQLAQKKASSDDITEFVQRMVGDHTKLGDQMQSVVERIGLLPPFGTPVAGKVLKAKLDVLSCDAFDKAYIKAMVEAHRANLKAFQDEATDGTDQGVKDAAMQDVDIVQAHLQMAERIAKSHNVDVDN